MSTRPEFVLAGVVLLPLPSAAQARALAQALAGGFRGGALAALGLSIDTVVRAVGAVLRVSVTLSTSAAAFAMVQWLGAAHLPYRGAG